MSIKTLLVDDDRSLLNEGKTFLERINEEIEILTVSSAKRALEMIDEEDLDVIVSDYKMPDIDGLEFLEELREERDSDVPFIIFTGKGEEELAMKALNLGVGRYIKKGNDPKSQYGVLADAIVQEYEYWGARRELERSEVKSRQKYEKIFHETPLGAFHYDEQGITMECNDRFVEIVGSSREDVIGLDMLNDLENDELVEEVRSSLEEGEGYYEGEYTSVTGKKTIEVRVFLRGIEDEDGQIKSGIGLVEDNTERKEYEQELKRKERYLDHTPTFVTVIDEEGEMKYHSYPSDEETGLESSEIVGMDAVEYAHPDDKEEVLKMFSEVMENPREEFITELRVESGDGWRWLEIRGVNYLDDPDINGIIVTSQDISERKKAEEELKKQEEKYRSIFEQFQDLYYKADLEGNIQELSPSVKPLSGYTRDELIGEPVSKVYSDPEDRAEMLDELVENGEVKGYEIKLEKKSGEKTVVSVNSHLIKDENGEIKGIEGTIRDITERKKAEEALEEEKRRYETLFEENPESVVEVNEDYRIAKVNERFEKLFDYEEEEIIRKELDDLLVPEDKMEEAKKLNKKSKREGYFDYETVRLTRDGNEVNVSITGRPIKYGGKIRHLAVYRDITERKEAEEREKFLHSLLRHDIKNKSQAVQGFLQLLEEKKLSEDSRELIEGAIKANKESVNLIQKVRLLLSAQEEEKKPVNIASTIHDAVRANEGFAKKEGIDLSVECPSSECRVEGGSLLDEVFYNIIENSINHSEGSKIKISGEVTDDEVICSIEDDGIGIPEDKKETIFEKGYTTDEDRGTGLGLFLVKNLLKSYGGSVEVNDSDMGGTRFDVRLKKISQG